MEYEKIISKTERRSLLALSFLTFAFFASFFVLDGIHKYNAYVADRQRELQRQADGTPRISFAVDDFAPRVPGGFHLVTFLIFLSLITPGRFLVSTGLTLLYAGLLLFSLCVRLDGKRAFGGSYSSDIGIFGELFDNTWIWDHVGGVFILIVGFWLTYILLRLNPRLFTPNLYR